MSEIKNCYYYIIIIGLKKSHYISKFAENCSADKVSIISHLVITTFFILPLLALETGCFLNISTY